MGVLMRFLCTLMFVILPFLACANQGMNPDISFNFLGLYQYDKDKASLLEPDPSDPTGATLSPSAHANSLRLQEAEIFLFSDVDPYFRAVAALSVAADTAPFNSFGINPEEVYAEATGIELLTLKLGKFKAAVGRNNNLHTH